MTDLRLRYAKRLLVGTLLVPLVSFAQDNDIADIYVGDLQLNATNSLPLQLNLTATDSGYTATLDSPAQGAQGIPIDSVEVSSSALSFSSSAIQASFSGTIDDNRCYAGEFTQGQSFSLTLCPADEAVAVPSVEEQLKELPASVAIIEADDSGWSVEREIYNVEPDRPFEIGSSTKTMVAFLLANAITADELSADTTLGSIWPEANDKVAAITLAELATHHSGLPRLPANLAPADMNDPYVDYGIANLTTALQASEVNADKTYEYSNFGFGLLAETLAKHYDTSFAELLQQQIFKPLAMNDSTVAINDVDTEKMAPGTRIDGETVPHWHFDALAGAGAVVATTDDMVRYLQAMMQPSAELKPVVEQVTQPRKTLSKRAQQAYGWIIEEREEGTIIWHNGQTAGFTSFIGFTADGQRGVVILNAQSRTVTDMGKQLLLR